MKGRVAILLQGGIGGGNFSQGCPPLFNIVMGLSKDFELTVYSILPANKDFIPSGFNFRTIHHSISSRKIRTVLICFLFLHDHLRKSYRLLHAFSAYPAGTIAVILGKLTRVPSLVTIQGGEAAAIPKIDYGNMIKPWLKKITLWTCKNASCLNSVSEFLLNELYQHGLKWRENCVIPFGADATMFVREEKKANSEILRVIHVANLTEVKDQVTLLKAFALLIKEQPAEIKIIGGDFLEGKIQLLANKMKLNDHVKFLGAIPNKDLFPYYLWADIMMHTSLHEGLPSVAAEAMACGVVVCGTRVGILSDLGNDYFETVDVGDHQALVSRILSLWKDKNRYNELSKKSFAWAQQFDLTWTVKQFGTLYECILNRIEK